MAVLFLIGEGKEEPEVITQLLGNYFFVYIHILLGQTLRNYGKTHTHAFICEATLNRVFEYKTLILN